MFNHILVPVDFSDRNQQALDIAVETARTSHGRVSLLHVIKLIAGGEYEEFEDFYQKLEGEAQEKMAVLCRPFAEEAVEINTQILIGHRVREIVTYADENEVDLIVMNSHKIDLQTPDEGWGTISHKVGILAQCPILLVK